MSASNRKMQDTTAAGEDRLATLLARLSTAPETLAAERDLLPQSPKARLRAILREIDETVLPRFLAIRSGQKTIARLTVTNRRLSGLELAGAAATPEDPQEMARAFAKGLARIAQAPHPLSLTAQHRDARPEQPQSACSVQTLETLLGLEPEKTPLARLADELAALSEARLIWSPATPGPVSDGAPQWQALLAEMAQRFRTLHDKPRKGPRIGPNRTEGVAIPLSSAHVLILAGLPQDGFAAVVPLAAGLAALARWQTPA